MFNFLYEILNRMRNGVSSLPILIGIILAVAFVAMLIVTVVTLISIHRAEAKAKKLDIPPSATKNNEQTDGVLINNQNTKMPPPVGNTLNKFLISRGYITVNNIVVSFFKAMDFLKESLGHDYKYKIPWFLIVGGQQSGKSSLLSGFTHDQICDDENEDVDCTWWFLKGGVILDIKGRLMQQYEKGKHGNKSWNMILGMLARYRSAKPLNGIILTIPATELYGRTKLSNDEIKVRAQAMAHQLNFAQRYLGIKLPIYIVITKSDAVPGFQSFCSEIPARNRGNMLGWSCPYSLNTIYDHKWIDEAFDFIEDSINDLRMEIFAENASSSTRDGIFVFPSELLSIKEYVCMYTDAIFRTNSIDDGFFLRGIYFTGDSKMIPISQFTKSADVNDMAIVGTPDADINEAGNTTLSFKEEEFVSKKIFFFDDLLLKKIFLEDGIAVPIRSKLRDMNKSIFLAKASTAAFVTLGSYGLFNARDTLKFSKDNLYPSLAKVSSIVKNTSNLTERNFEVNKNDILSECSSQLLSVMRQIGHVTFSSMFVPASWFSNIRQKLYETLRISYQRVIVRTIYMNLILRTKEILNTRPSLKDFSTKIGELLDPYKSKEYKLLAKYVGDLAELHRNIQRFDSLRISGDPDDLANLVDYTFKGSLPREFIENYSQFRAILINTAFPPIDLAPYKRVAYDTLIVLFKNFLNAVFSDNKGSMIDVLNGFVNRLNNQNIANIPDCEYLVSFSKSLTKVCKRLGECGKTWLDEQVFKPSQEYDQLLDTVEDLFGKNVAQYLLDITAMHFEYLKARIATFNRIISPAPITQIANDNKPLTEQIYLMEAALHSICQEPYMQKPGPYKLVTTIPAGKIVYWDDDLVQNAYNMVKSFEESFISKVRDFPMAMQDGLTLLVRSNLCAVVASKIAQAQNFIDEPSALTNELTMEEVLQKQVASIRDTAPKLVKILTLLRESKFNFVFSDLRTILNKLCFSMLEYIEQLLDKAAPYTPKDLSFSYWNGRTGAAMLAFSLKDYDELSSYFAMQRKVVERFANFADPLVQVLNTSIVFDTNNINYPKLLFWVKFVDAVKGMVAKYPSNSVKTLENFIWKTLNKLKLDNVTTEIPVNDIHGESSDFFFDIIKKIKRGIARRGEVLVRKRNIERYNTLLNYYNTHLNGKFPFTNYNKSQRVAEDADVDAVKTFFKMYQDFGGTPEKVLDQIYQLGDIAKPNYEFLQKIHDLFVFIGDYVNTQHDTPRLSIAIDFDVNKRSESNVSYIVDRIFKPNNDSNIEFTSDDKSGMWYFGEPISFVLRYVTNNKNADQPSFNINNPDIIVNDNTATIECVGNWAILRFLQKFRSRNTNNVQLLKNQVLLRFDVSLTDNRTSRVFAAFTVYKGDDNKTSVKVPENPGVMPALSDEIVNINSSVVYSDEGVYIPEKEKEQPEYKDQPASSDNGEKLLNVGTNTQAEQTINPVETTAITQ